MNRYLCSLVALGLLQGVTGQVKAQPIYAFTTFDVPGSSRFTTQPNGINASGQIVGSYNGHGFLIDQGSYITTFDVPGSTWTSATGINASGQIVGSYQDAAGQYHGFLLDQGSYTTIDVPGFGYTNANGINASGQIVGYYTDGYGNSSSHGFLLDNEEGFIRSADRAMDVTASINGALRIKLIERNRGPRAMGIE
jgi:probable HAF family extracellular repeat protein